MGNICYDNSIKIYHRVIKNHDGHITQTVLTRKKIFKIVQVNIQFTHSIPRFTNLYLQYVGDNWKRVTPFVSINTKHHVEDLTIFKKIINPSSFRVNDVEKINFSKIKIHDENGNEIKNWKFIKYELILI